MSLSQLYSDFSVDYKTEGHKHAQIGWINVPCPFCTGNQGYHLGYNENENYFHCWRCGGKPIIKAISQILNIQYPEARKLAHQYKIFLSKSVETKKLTIRKKSLKFPPNCGGLDSSHINYLNSRNFDHKILEKTWEVQGTGPMSVLDDIDFKHRLVYPIYWDGEIVSFQTRAAHNKATLKYITCKKDREKVHHKDIIYRHPKAVSKIGFATEGVFDVWRLGVGAFCTFGIEFTPKQVRAIKNLYEKVFIIFDDEIQAKIQAEKLKASLSEWGVVSEVISIKGDPGDLSPEDGEYLVNNLKKGTTYFLF